MSRFRVVIELDIEAPAPYEAARAALAKMSSGIPEDIMLGVYPVNDDDRIKLSQCVEFDHQDLST